MKTIKMDLNGKITEMAATQANINRIHQAIAESRAIIGRLTKGSEEWWDKPLIEKTEKHIEKLNGYLQQI